MPKTVIKGVKISQIWDDKSETEFEIERHESEEFGPLVHISCAADSVRINDCSWPEIKEQIDNLFNIDM